MAEPWSTTSWGTEMDEARTETPTAGEQAGIDRVEFRRGINDVHRQVADVDESVANFGAELRKTIGWMAMTIGLCTLLCGWIVLTNRPRIGAAR
jgi:hypothetical protein